MMTGTVFGTGYLRSWSLLKLPDRGRPVCLVAEYDHGR
jgi:hypothetical protein